MDENKLELTRNKYKLLYHWTRDPLHKYSLPYFGYAQIVLDELPRPPAPVFDAGCGDGRISAELVKQGYKVTGADFLELPVLYARHLVPEGEFFVADLRHDLVATYGLQEEQFQAVVMVEVYEHIPPEDCLTVLANIRQVLRVGGTLIVSVPSLKLPMSQLHYRHFDEDQIRDEITKSGFSVQKTIYQHGQDFLTHLLLSDIVEGVLNNKWLQPVFLKRLRRHWYMKYGNIARHSQQCGRYIIIATR